MNALEKFMTFLGIVGFGLLVPVTMYIVGAPGPVNFLQENLGGFGNPSVITLISFVMLGLLIVFGGGDNIKATFIGLLAGFALVSTAIEIDFMNRYRETVIQWPLFSNIALNYLCGIGVVFLGVALSFVKKIPTAAELGVLLILPLGVLFANQQLQFFAVKSNAHLSLSKGISALSSVIDEKYRSMPQVVAFIDEISKDESLSEQQKKDKVDALNGKIDKLEGDSEILSQLRQENSKFKQLLEEQKKQLSKFEWCPNARQDETKITSFDAAVQADKPCVRDYAVSLASKSKGSYHSAAGTGIPSETGLKQIFDIHTHLSQNWQYINDPTMVRDEFLSPADRTIALNLAGDCDDFAIIMSSCVEAIGGVCRIMGGCCEGGCHAWSEVLIGGKNEWENAQKVLRGIYQSSGKKLTPSIEIFKGKEMYFLPLDWRMGEYTCNTSDTEKLFPLQ